MLRRESARQVLQVADQTRKNYQAGIPVRHACQQAIREVAKRYGVSYQTIGDGCRRRLRLDQIRDFHVLVQKWLDGNPKPLQQQLLDNADANCHADIQQFFGATDIQSSDSEKISKQNTGAAMETFLVDLPRADALRLRFLCTVEDKPPSKMIFEIVTANVERQLRPHLEKLVNDPNTPYEWLQE